ncbi:hypothetical protein A4H97_22330 [Niastella yeongjuensis]|uniref:Uncharacterized protein n=1 Tax=Niastella yeongjuensis TaxID=354355 RepID=A0A1V9F7M5_9BACT|nr:glycosyltransferase family 39 protein [Niastella yeongjuensis]OQP54237.1 hypothetical protein A4H97_22330 [Niastella yeongjuensis]SEP31505.1 Dolichyl-phosphate-mannose-protein mannosyltransferase [Niastella yeongjuensis]
MKQYIRLGFLPLFVIWAIIQGIFIYHHGIITTGEPEKYITEGHGFLATGTLSAPKYWLYFTQIGLLAIAFKTGLGYSFALVVQLLFSALATWSFYQLLGRLFPYETAFIGTLLLLLNYPFQEFNVYLQTESIFYSFTILFSTYMLQLSKLTPLRFTGILTALAILCITRPTGILFVPVAFIYLFFAFLKNMDIKLKIAITCTVAVIFIWVLNTLLGSGGDLDFMLPYREEHIICGFPTLNQPAAIDSTSNGNSVYGLLYYITHNFSQFSRLALFKCKSFFALMRPYYSTGHNILLAAYFYPLYALAILSINWWRKHQAYPLLYVSGLILITLGTTLLTCDDWHNRWFLTISPYLLLLALPAINKLVLMLQSRGQ